MEILIKEGFKNSKRFISNSIKPNKLDLKTINILHRFLYDNKHLHYLIENELDDIYFSFPTFLDDRQLENQPTWYIKESLKNNDILVKYDLVESNFLYQNIYHYKTSINASNLLVLLNDGIISLYINQMPIINKILSLENEFRSLDKNQLCLF